MSNSSPSTAGTINTVETPTVPVQLETLTAKELARRWRVTLMTLRRWRNAGSLRTLKIGPRKIIFPMAEVERFERERRA
jgi:excisionase family DNA binding protein